MEEKFQKRHVTKSTLLFALFASSCNSSDGQSSLALEAEKDAVLRIPAVRNYPDTLQIRVVLPRQYIWAADSDEARRGLKFKPID